jgi:ABC-2 type transport system ATP-binding protein
MTRNNTALELRGVVMKFGSRVALDGFNMKVPRGSTFGLVGSNGAGKTTSIAVASGLLRLDSGSVNVLGDGFFDPLAHSGRISMMPQDAELPLYAKVRDILKFYARLQGLPASRIDEEVDRVIEWVHLADRAKSVVRSLSHGMRRRVVVAQAFLGNPELILLDEPMSGLDPREVVNIRNLLLKRIVGQTVVVSSHNLHELELICDHVAFIEDGKLVRQDSMNNIMGHRQVINIELGALDGLNLDGLRKEIPDVSIELLEESNMMRCRYSKSEHSTAQLNGIILGYLLDQKFEILEVRRGNNLETAYIDYSKRRGEGVASKGGMA